MEAWAMDGPTVGRVSLLIEMVLMFSSVAVTTHLSLTLQHVLKCACIYDTLIWLFYDTASAGERAPNQRRE